MKRLILIALIFICSVGYCETTAVVGPGSAIRMYLKSCDGTTPFTYQWRKNGVDIPGATAYEYNIPSAVVGDTATYTLKVMNSAGFCISDNYYLTVNTGLPTNAQITIMFL